MIIEQLITADLPVLLPSDTGDKAVSLMEEYKVGHLSLVADGEYKALIGEEELLQWDTPERALSTAGFLHSRPVVYGHLHPYEAVSRAIQQDISIVPVINIDNKYLGAISRSDLLDYLVRQSGLEKPGGIVTLLVRPSDYSLSEIARICENNDITILNLQVFAPPESEQIEVTIKTNSKELQALVASFERYEYTVKEVFGEMLNAEGIEERYRLLMNYINM